VPVAIFHIVFKSQVAFWKVVVVFISAVVFPVMPVEGVLDESAVFFPEVWVSQKQLVNVKLEFAVLPNPPEELALTNPFE
jgi:hypothetical protein